ncbi:MAG: DUF6585 family protein [Omnitrophica WOR_2 bacterium]
MLLPGIFFAGLSLFTGLLCAFYAYVNYGPAAASRWSIPWFWLSFVILILWSALSLVRLLPHTRTISVYPHGIYLSGFWGTAFYQREPLDIPWEQMTGISIEFTPRGSKEQAKTCQRAVLFRKQGRPIHLEQAKNSLNGFENLPELSSQIKAHLYARLAPAYQSQYKNGQMLAFGPISIHCDYLILSGQPGNIAWSRVRQINIRSGYLVVELDGPDSNTMIKRFPISRVPNLELLLDLIEHHTVYM